MTKETEVNYNCYLTSTHKEPNLRNMRNWLKYLYTSTMADLEKKARIKNAGRQPVLTEIQVNPIVDSRPKAEAIPPVINSVQSLGEDEKKLKLETIEDTPMECNLLSKQTRMMEERCDLCYELKHIFSCCRVYMSMSPDQRKLALLNRDACYRCTTPGHIANQCDQKHNCQKCQQIGHHESICDASVDSWSAVINKKWNGSKNTEKTGDKKVAGDKTDKKFSPKPSTKPSTTKNVHFEQSAKNNKPKDKVAFLAVEGEGMTSDSENEEALQNWS